MSDDINYLRKRAIQEQLAAQNAKCAIARRRHDELAAMYRFKVGMLSNPWSKAGVAIALQRVSRELPFAQMKTERLRHRRSTLELTGTDKVESSRS